MHNQPVRLGLIGLGAVGQRIVRMASEHPEMAIAALCDTNEQLAARTSEQLGGVPWFTDYRRVIESDVVDVVYVGVPPKLHRRMVLDAIDAGKHIFCEKPLALTLAEAREMTERAEAAGIVTAINLPLFRHPGVLAFGERLREGQIGDLRRAALELVFPQWPRGWQQNPWIGKREQGGPIREVGPHMFEVILSQMGDVVRVWAHMEYPPGEPEACEQAATGLLELDSGQVVTVSALCNVPRPETVSLTAYGTAGTLGLVRWAEPVAASGNGPLEPLPVELNAPDRYRLSDALVRAVRGEAVPLPDFRTGLRIQQVLDAWERSAESGRWVTIEKSPA